MRRRALGLGLALGLLSTPTIPAERSHDSVLAEARSAVGLRQNTEQKLQDIGYRLTTGNAPFCTVVVPSIGLNLHDMAGYPQPDLMQRALELTLDFAVNTVAAGSPAERAGLRPNQPIVSVGETQIDQWPAKDGLDWQRLERVHDLVDATLAGTGKITLGLEGDAIVEVSGTPACASRFELSGGEDTALADGNRVRFSAGYPAFAYPDDELAAVIAHELAHNLLKHRAWLDTHGRERKQVRMTEREADRLAPWLLANAGFDPEAALRFMRRWGPEHGSGIFRKRTHEGWDERAQHIAAEIPLVLQALEEDGHADWKIRFKREISLP